MIETLIGGALGLLGGLQQQDAAKEAAQKQMDFQLYMSNSAYQRAVQDLKLAGLNPMLAYRQPASTPQGASAAVENIATSAAQGAQAATQAQLVSANVEKTKAETGLINQQTLTEELERRANLRAQTGLYTSSADQAQAGAANTREQLYVTTKMIEQVASQTDLNRELANLHVQQRRLVIENISNAIAERARIIADTGLKHAEIPLAIARTGEAKADTILKQLQEPLARLLADSSKDDLQKLTYPYLRQLEIGGHTATQILNPLRRRGGGITINNTRK